MSERTIGIAMGTILKVLVPEAMSTAPGPAKVLAAIRKAEELGIMAAWSTTPGHGDALTLLTAAAAQTERILLGTSIVHTWSSHPVGMAQHAQVAASIAPGRFRLGVGPGHRDAMERRLGMDFRAPLGHLKEYLRILKGLLQNGEIDFDGRYYTAHAMISAPVDLPVMASALRPKSFELCGAEADGAISWICPFNYLRDIAIPAMMTGAERAGRPAPPLIAHALVCVHENIAEVYAAVRDEFGFYPRLPFYASMFEAAGFPGAAETGWTDEMLDSVVVCGDEAAVTMGIERIFDLGASEVSASVITGTHPEGGPGPSEKSFWQPRSVQGKLAEEPAERTLKLLAQLSDSGSA